MSKHWSNYQTAIFDFAVNGVGNAIVKAVAGSGKTTTIVETLNRVQGTSIFLAFNKSIAEELKARGVNARTFHSLTYSAVTRHKGTRNVDGDKLRKLCDKHLSGDEAFMYGAFLARLVGLGRQAGIGCLVADTEQAWVELVDHHDLELENEGATYSRAIELASQLLTWSNASNLVDFDDLLYVAVADGLVLPKFDFVFVDEAQDTNAIQRALLRKIMHPHSRMIAVGDPAQAIYGFRGADSDSLDLIAEEFECRTLPLTVSYRCPVRVVEFARQWVEHIEPAPNAPEGQVTELAAWDASTFAPHDLVVCRTTKPLITLAFKLMRARVPAYIMGREIGAGLTSLIKRMRASDLDTLEHNLEQWAAREEEKALAKRQEAKVEAIRDKSDALLCLIRSLPEDSRTVADLLDVIDSLFRDKGQAVKLATIHKAKGLEADRVYWLNRSQCPAKWAKQPWQKQQEMNLCYVAATRAVKELVLIEEKVKAAKTQAA